MDNLDYLLERYNVRENGVVVNKSSNMEISAHSTLSGRKYIAIPCGYSLYKYDLATLLASLYIPNPRNLKHIKFKDGDITNCSLENISWSSFNGRTDSKMKEVVMFSLDDKEIRRFNSLKEAAEHMNVSPVSISYCCKGKTKTSCGYKWRFSSDINEKKIYWLDLNDADCSVLWGTSDENIQEFISIAEQRGNVASVDFFINNILNNDEIETSNNVFKYI